MTKKRRAVWMRWSVLAIVLAGIVVTTTAWAAKRSTGATAESVSLVSASGTGAGSLIAAPGLVEAIVAPRDLAFQAPGRIAEIRVEEGQEIKKGEPLAELDHEESRARVAAAQAEFAAAKAQCEELTVNMDAEATRAECEVQRLEAEYERQRSGPRKEEILCAQAETKAAEIEWNRRVQDAERYASHPTVSSQQERDMTQGLAEITHAQFLASKARLDLLQSGTRPEDIARAAASLKSAQAEQARVQKTRSTRLRIAEEAVAQAQARMNSAQNDLRKTTLESPIDGVVVWRFRHPGETVGVLPPERVLTVADISHLRVRADVDECDFAKIKPGMKVRVTADAYGGRSFEGRVDRVSCSAGEKRFTTGESREHHDVKIVETLVTFDETPPFKLGLRVTVYFEVN